MKFTTSVVYEFLCIVPLRDFLTWEQDFGCLAPGDSPKFTENSYAPQIISVQTATFEYTLWFVLL